MRSRVHGAGRKGIRSPATTQLPLDLSQRSAQALPSEIRPQVNGRVDEGRLAGWTFGLRRIATRHPDNGEAACQRRPACP